MCRERRRIFLVFAERQHRLRSIVSDMHVYLWADRNIDRSDVAHKDSPAGRRSEAPNYAYWAHSFSGDT
jgi:hypothetical protein